MAIPCRAAVKSTALSRVAHCQARPLQTTSLAASALSRGVYCRLLGSAWSTSLTRRTQFSLAYCCARRLVHAFSFSSPQGLSEWMTTCTVRQTNLFAQSRITNYLKRVVRDEAAVANVLGLFATERMHVSPPVFKTTLSLPVDVLVQNQVTRCDVQACGFGADARAARAACCMHAERCLDCLGVPLYASPQRQDEHAKEALRDGGRFAPKHGELPNELSAVTLPPPIVASSPLYAIFTAPAPSSATGAPSQPETAEEPAQVGSSVTHGRFPHPRQPPRRVIRFDHHYGPDPFLHRVEAELDGLRDSILSLQTSAMAAADAADSNSHHHLGHNNNEDGDDDEAEMGDVPVVIEASEVAVLQPDGDTAFAHTAAQCVPARAPRVAVAYASSRAVSEMRYPARLPVDESEGGHFDLVEGDGEDWCVSRSTPGAGCIYDPYALDRVTAYYQALPRATTTTTSAVDGEPSIGRFEDHLKLTASEEETSVRTGRGTYRAAPRQWWTASAPVPRYETAQLNGVPLRAIGKATTVEHATVLCAMHMELLLGFLGEPLWLDDASAQVRYYDACLCWGRPIAPLPWMAPSSSSLATTTTAAAPLPKPLKQWFRPERTRLRHAPLTVTEKLLALNRAVVTDCRQHLVEVDLFDHPRCEEDGYRELLDLAVPCVRAFLQSQRHPYEGAYFVYTFTKNSEYRASLYLPLPARYGVRGGYAVASTPARALTLCALHAVDVLCSLGIIPLIFDPRDDAKWQRLLFLREKLGLTLPVSTAAAASAVNPHLRSPPAYRESPGHASTVIPAPAEVWRTMLLDASWFDIVPDGRDLQLSVPPGTKLPYGDVLTVGRHLFLAYATAAAGWQRDDVVRSLHHYCGRQHHRGHRRRVANTFWMRLPLDEQRYGARVAIGRCITRKGAERNFYLHAFRILATLDLLPWTTQSRAELQQSMYGGNATRASLDMSLWNAVAPLVLDPARHHHITGVTAAEPIGTDKTAPASVDKRSVSSPHPIMSYELARGTL